MIAKRLTMLPSIPISHPITKIDTKDTFEYEGITTITTLAARHLIIGEVTHVSSVFEDEFFGPISFVTVRVDKDMMAEMTEDQVTPARTVSFFQIGGPLTNGAIVKAVGFPLLKGGDYVFLRLMPSGYSVTHNGITVDSCTDEYDTIFFIEDADGGIDQHIIKKCWQGLDVDVMQMTRIVRATLREPHTMRALERQMSELKHCMTKAARVQMVMDQVNKIEASLNLPVFDRQFL